MLAYGSFSSTRIQIHLRGLTLLPLCAMPRTHRVLIEWAYSISCEANAKSCSSIASP